MTNEEKELLLEVGNCLSEIINSAYLDNSEMSSDCLEVFDTYDWEPKEGLSEQKRVRWDELLEKGNNCTMDGDELLEFLDLVNPSGQLHVFFNKLHAKVLIEKINCLK